MIHEKAPKNQTISQVFSAAFNFKGKPALDQTDKALSKWVLDAMYEGILKAAFVKNKTKIFLSLVGGGDFCNPPDIIIDATVKQIDFIIASGLQVYLITYAYNEEIDKQQNLLKAVEYSSGTFTLYDQSGKKMYFGKGSV